MASGRYQTTIIKVIVADVERDAEGKPHWKAGTDRVLGLFGGTWDRRRRGFVPARGRANDRVLEMRFHVGQEDAIRWFVDWLRRFLRGDWNGVRRPYSALLVGGRRSGKTHLSCAIMIVFAVTVPGSKLWAISPTLETGAELDGNFREQIPREFAKRKAGDESGGRATEYRFVNGSCIRLRSAVKPERLKAGRADITLLNEAQLMNEQAYIKVRAAAADRGGLVLLAANPPDAPIGRWIERQYMERNAGLVDGVLYQFDPRRNPFVEYAALESMRAEVSAADYDREVIGIFVPIGEPVFFDWRDADNWRDPPAHLVDVTAEITLKTLGRAASDIVGMDFQRTPAMVGAVCRWYRDPANPGVDMLWVVDEAVIEESDESDLVDALESMPRYHLGDGPPARRVRDENYRGWIEPGSTAHAACVIDASGFWQDGEHNQGRTSDLHLKARRWNQLYKPQKDSDRNPAIVERMKAGNAMILNGNGLRRLFVAKHCAKVAEAMRNYENKNGSANRRSQYAHVADAVTYVVYRFTGRPRKPTTSPVWAGPIGKFGRGKLFPR